jgi:hypothetical protein
MQLVDEIDPTTVERLEKQGDFLLRIYRREFAKDPGSCATRSSRSNVIALQHSVRQIYGVAAVSRSRSTYFPSEHLKHH